MCTRNESRTRDIKRANKKVKEIYEKWIQMHNKLAIYIEHDELEKIETDLVATKSNIEIKEYETGIEKIDTCKFILEHVKDKEKLSWTNIF